MTGAEPDPEPKPSIGKRPGSPGTLTVQVGRVGHVDVVIGAAVGGDEADEHAVADGHGGRGRRAAVLADHPVARAVLVVDLHPVLVALVLAVNLERDELEENLRRDGRGGRRREARERWGK